MSGDRGPVRGRAAVDAREDRPRDARSDEGGRHDEDRRFGEPDGHLGIIGVPDLFLGISDQLLDRRETGTDRFGALCLKLTPERVADGEAEEATRESILQL